MYTQRESGCTTLSISRQVVILRVRQANVPKVCAVKLDNIVSSKNVYSCTAFSNIRVGKTVGDSFCLMVSDGQKPVPNTESGIWLTQHRGVLQIHYSNVWEPVETTYVPFDMALSAFLKNYSK